MTTRQHSFYLEDDDWTALRHLCLDRGISVSAFIAQAARNAIGKPVEVKLKLEASATTAPVEAEIYETSVVKDPPHPSMTVKRAGT